MTETREDLLRRAIELADRSMRDLEGGPFGAVIVRDGIVLAEGVNRVTSKNDPTAHAEVEAIREACRKLDTYSLEACEIYSSCEPCPMCLGAIYWARLGALYFANTRAEAAAIGFDDEHIYREVPKALWERSMPTQHIAVPEAKALFDRWQTMPDKVLY